MKIILKEEVDNLGLPGDVVDVADGYGRNFLLPRGLAIPATAGAMKEAEAITRARKAREAKTVGTAQAHKETLEARTLRVEARVDEFGHLYGSVSVSDVERVLKERGHEIEKRRIDLKRPIKQIGTYEIPVRIHPQVTATLTLDVVDVEGKVKVAGEEAPSIEEAALEAVAELEAEEAAEAVEAEAGDAPDSAEASESKPTEDAVEAAPGDTEAPEDAS